MADKPEPFEGPDREAAKRSAEELAVAAGAGRGTGAATAVALSGEGPDVACARRAAHPN
jgi:NAD(P)-dependent dehydrogenase (short-subunit alcohol dehydrogenase family)